MPDIDKIRQDLIEDIKRRFSNLNNSKTFGNCMFLCPKSKFYFDDPHVAEETKRRMVSLVAAQHSRDAVTTNHINFEAVEPTSSSCQTKSIWQVGRLLEQKNAVNLYCVEHGRVDSLQSNEWVIVKNLTSMLTFFYEATLELSFDNACISIVIPLISLLNRKLQVRCESDNEMMTNMKNSLYESMNIRFSSLKKLPSLMVTTILDPRFKSKYLNSNEVDIAVTELISFLTKSEDSMQSSRSTDNANDSSASTTCVSQTHHIQQKKESLWDVHDDNTSSHTETTESEEDIKHFLKEKIQSYLSEPLLITTHC
ncbi:zinc finger BED domain-containing protein 4-like [Spodoptera frugiperda]|uniref:Zinc finger BED domain-containing protein 4-like n=1 Tax=Spodoptera frugiperda TaxID=7108 RepID=A0A9R0CVR0_SPOFR|nr:zinc finger BED domain-containing protein 4-like [Spodoptera frugiperda]